MNRILTIQVEIIDQEKAGWIWRNHMGEPDDTGVSVQAIQNGKMPKEMDS